MEQLIEFQTAKLAKEKGFNWETLHFYTKPGSKMLGIDERGRYYPMKNISKKIYTRDKNVAVNMESVYQAPTQSSLQRWLREVYNIIVIPDLYGDDLNANNLLY